MNERNGAFCWPMMEPTDQNRYSLFQEELEDDPLVLFHATPSRNLASILSGGFRSAHSLGAGELRSVSYARRSSGCLAHVKNVFREEYAVIAVRFDSLDVAGIRNNPSDIHVDNPDLQPKVLGYCIVPGGYQVK